MKKLAYMIIFVLGIVFMVYLIFFAKTPDERAMERFQELQRPIVVLSVDRPNKSGSVFDDMKSGSITLRGADQKIETFSMQEGIGKSLIFDFEKGDTIK